MRIILKKRRAAPLPFHYKHYNKRARVCQVFEVTFLLYLKFFYITNVPPAYRWTMPFYLSEK